MSLSESPEGRDGGREALSERIVAFADDPLVTENLERALKASSE